MYHRQKSLVMICERRGWPLCLYDVYTVHLSFYLSPRFDCCFVYVHIMFHWTGSAAFVPYRYEAKSRYSSSEPNLVQI